MSLEPLLLKSNSRVDDLVDSIKKPMVCHDVVATMLNSSLEVTPPKGIT